MKIVVDCLGADKGYAMVVEGALNALKLRKGFDIALCGKESEIRPLITDKNLISRIEIIDCQDEITCEEEPVKAFKAKPESSIVKGLERLHADDECKAFVSAGSTGAVLVGATLKIGRLKGISRPALCPILPAKDGKKVLLLDCGANADCKPINLCHFAIMASCFAEAVLGVKEPKIALLSNGTEAQKGNQLVHDVYPMLSGLDCINFYGNAEGRQLFDGDFDALVTDGFSGNIQLKSAEGAIKFLMHELKKSIKSSFKAKLGGLMLKKTLKKTMLSLDYANQGGAMFIGLKKLVFKAHGVCDSSAITNTIFQAVEAEEKGFVNAVSEKLEKTDLIQFKAE